MQPSGYIMAWREKTMKNNFIYIFIGKKATKTTFSEYVWDSRDSFVVSNSSPMVNAKVMGWLLQWLQYIFGAIKCMTYPIFWVSHNEFWFINMSLVGTRVIALIVNNLFLWHLDLHHIVLISLGYQCHDLT